MRRFRTSEAGLLRETCSLLKLKNVRLKPTHAVIDGERYVLKSLSHDDDWIMRSMVITGLSST